MINNFKQIRELLTFDNNDQFYFLQVLQRKKDAIKGQKINGTNNNSRLIKAYYVHSLEYFDFIENEVIQLCNLFNARAGINLNRRSYEKMALQHLKKVTDQIINKSYDKAHKAYSSVVGSYSQETDRTWIIDLDYIPKEEEVIKLDNFLYNIKPISNKIITTIPSKSGLHIITKPFNMSEWKESNMNMWSYEEIHKNNPTNLYIP